MAFFGVTLEEIDSVKTHPNADRLSVATMKGLAFQFVIAKDQFQVGERVLYFPIDALLPEPVISKLNLTGKLSGPKKNRIKSIKLREVISQGIVARPGLFFTPQELAQLNSDQITQKLGVEKHEPLPVFSNSADLVPLPTGIDKYDIEGADRFQPIIDELLAQDVVVTEKMEGSNFSIHKDGAGQIFVNQRNYSIKEISGKTHTFWDTARNLGLLEFMSKVPNETTIFAEICGPGIQGNIYGLKEVTLYVFDIRQNHQWLGFERFSQMMAQLLNKTRVKQAPVLYRGILKDYLNNNSVQVISNGPSQVKAEIKREGIVIKPVVEQTHPLIGRLIIKQRSPEYLAAEK